jgi:hypothetical protein
MDYRENKYKKFKYYLRQCKICLDIFKAYSHNGQRPQTRTCPICKDRIDKMRLRKIIETKLKVKALRMELEKC